MDKTTLRHKITIGDTRTAIGGRLRQGGRAVDTNGLTVKFRMIDSAGTVKVSDASASTISTSTCAPNQHTHSFYAADHSLEEDDEVVFTTTSRLPSGLEASRKYFVVKVTAHTFQVSGEKGGDPVRLLDKGSGTLSFRPIGHVQYAWSAGDVDTAGTYTAWFIVDTGSATDHFPSDQDKDSQRFVVEIYAKT